MNYLSTYRVLRRGNIRVFIPTFLSFFALMALAVFVGALTASIPLGILMVVLSFIVPIFIYQHTQLNWLVWAVKYVDNIPQFSKAGTTSLLIDYNGFPAVKTILPYKEKKKEIENIVFGRKEKGLFVVELSNVSNFSETHFYNSFVYYGLFLLLGLFFLSVWLIPSGDEAFHYRLLVCLVGTALGLPIAFWALKNIIDAEPAFSIGKYGVKTKKLNISWSEIEDITVMTNRSGTGRQQHISQNIKITYREKDGALNLAKIDISSLNTSLRKADEVVKAYRSKYLTQSNN